MSLVLDNSSTMAWIFLDETTDAIELLFSQVERGGAVVPALWEIEVANVLQMAVRGKKQTAQFRDRALAALAVLPIDVEMSRTDRVWGDSLHLAERHGLTVYDATYLEVAIRRRLPLATLDNDLRRAAGSEGIVLLGL